MNRQLRIILTTACMLGLLSGTVVLAEPNTPLRRVELPLRPPRHPVSVATGVHGIVTSETPLASKIGCDILARGGSAVDAAVAVAFALQVTWPEAGNIGGGGFMMIAPTDAPVEMIDYREKAPYGVSEDSLARLDDKLDIRFVGTPGSLRGLEIAHQKHGRLPWADLVRPSITLAQKGFAIDASLTHSLNWGLTTLQRNSDTRFDEFRRVYGHPAGRAWMEGDRLVQPDLATTLETIAQQGADAFYQGELADALIAEMRRQSGWITHDDLSRYTALQRQPIRCQFQGHDVYVPELPSAASTVIPMQLGMIERIHLPLSDTNQLPWSVDQVHLLAEVMKRAFRTRAAHLGDRDYVSIPSELSSDKALRQAVSNIDLHASTPSEDLAGDLVVTDLPYESEQTTHYSVLDSDGMGVSNTTTLEQNFGSRIVVRGAGFLLNNEMGDFNRKPGYTNQSGTIGTLANRIAPGKRMLSSMSPTIVKKDGKMRLLLGSPGGRTILNTVTLVLIQRLMLGRSLAESIDQPRFHHQWFPDEIQFEADHLQTIRPLLAGLRQRDHQIALSKRARQGAVHAIEISPATGIATGVSDWRRGGAARAAEQVLASDAR